MPIDSPWELVVAGGKQLTDKLHVLGLRCCRPGQHRVIRQSADRDGYLKNVARVTIPDTSGPTDWCDPGFIPTTLPVRRHRRATQSRA